MQSESVGTFILSAGAPSSDPIPGAKESSPIKLQPWWMAKCHAAFLIKLQGTWPCLSIEEERKGWENPSSNSEKV